MNRKVRSEDQNERRDEEPGHQSHHRSQLAIALLEVEERQREPESERPDQPEHCHGRGGEEDLAGVHFPVRDDVIDDEEKDDDERQSDDRSDDPEEGFSDRRAAECRF